MPAEMMPMMTTTTRISISVKPAAGAALRPAGALAPAALVAHVPVADVGIDALAPGGSIGSHAEQVVLPAVRARVDVLIVVPPGILADPLQIAAGPPVLDGGVGGLGHERGEPLLGGRVFRVVEPVHGERRFQALDVLLRLGDARIVPSAHDLRHDERSEQPDDDYDHHDLDQGEAVRVPGGAVGALSANLEITHIL